MKRLILIIAFLTLAGNYALADTGEDPPVVDIYDAAFELADTITVMEGEDFTLYGVATGEVPLYYFWYCDAVLIGTGNVLNYSIDDPGEHEIVLEVIDVNDRSGDASVMAIVEGSTVSNENTSWGRIKALSR